LARSFTHPEPSVRCARLSYRWPDGRTVFDGLDLAFGPGRTGLIGVNGSGKSTLLRLIAGELTPLAGAVRTTGQTGYLPQNLTLDTGRRLDEVLGIAEIRAALHAIEGGDVAEEHFTAVGDDWDIEERTQAVLGQLGLDSIGLDSLDRTIGEISGGESVLLRLAALLIARPGVLLLDEPTNNLDRHARERLHQAVSGWAGTLIVVSHDRELLELVGQIADLHEGEVRWYGGGYSDYETAVEAEQEVAQRRVRDAKSELRRQRRDLSETHVKLAKRAINGKKAGETKGLPKIVADARKRSAQESAGKQRLLHEQKVQEARERLDQAEDAVRDSAEIRVGLPGTRVPHRRRVLSLHDTVLRFGARAGLEVLGAERIALTGRNGAGKSTLLRTVAGELAPEQGEVTAHVPLRYLPQRLDVLDDGLSVLENVRRLAPTAREQDIRAQLARFLFTGERPGQPAGTLSGGERFRATLAALLLAQPAPQLLLLDEPTNNLDLASIRQLTSALESYAGALIVASHDLAFLRGLGITRWLTLDGELTETDPP
jgi:ATPase subunit of ABC transporter with duplicated ATPase domains